jgi:hypothetical protein
MMENAIEKYESKELSLIKVADTLFKSGLFPNAKNNYGAYAICQYGAELEIPPMTSLQTMAIISGKVCMSAQMMLTLALKRGVEYKITTDSDKEVVVIFNRKGFEAYTSSFSIEEAKRAGIFKAQGGWEKWPRDMCFWRAVTRGLRRIAPDVILGLYAIEEIKDAPPLNEPVEAEVVNGKTEGEPIPPDPTITFDSAYQRMNEIKNVFELKNWWTKHYKEINVLPEAEQKELTAFKDHLKTQFEEKK